MAVRRLPVLQPDPYHWPRTVADCDASPRPCPLVRCRYNLLIDITTDGALVLNVPGPAEARQFPDKHAHKADLVWYVEVRLPGDQAYALGPCGSRQRAEQVAAAWRAEYGAGTTAMYQCRPAGLEAVGESDGAIDLAFAEAADAAVERWFDDPDPDMPSCLRDEVMKLAQAQDSGMDDGALLEWIADRLHVSRERVRQIGVGAMRGFLRGMAELGIDRDDLTEER